MSPNLPFLELLTEFTNKLLRQDKKVMMMEMMIIVVMMMMITMAGGADLPRQEVGQEGCPTAVARTGSRFSCTGNDDDSDDK